MLSFFDRTRQRMIIGLYTVIDILMSTTLVVFLCMRMLLIASVDLWQFTGLSLGI